MLHPEIYGRWGQQNCHYQNTQCQIMLCKDREVSAVSPLELQWPLPEWHFLENLIWASPESFENWGLPFVTISQSFSNYGSFDGEIIA